MACPPPDLPPWHPSGPIALPIPFPPPPPGEGVPGALLPVPRPPVPVQPPPPADPEPLPPGGLTAITPLEPLPAPPLPPRRVGRGSGGGPATVSVDNNRCHLYAICQMEAPSSFELGADGRLRYDKAPPDQVMAEVRQAARLCPMQAIALRERA